MVIVSFDFGLLVTPSARQGLKLGSTAETFLHCMSAFYTAVFASHGSLTEPKKCFFDVGQGERIFAAFELGILETFKTADDHDEEVFVANAVHATFLDGAFLKVDTFKFMPVISFADNECMRGVVLVIFFFKNLRVLRRKKVMLCLSHFH